MLEARAIVGVPFVEPATVSEVLVARARRYQCFSAGRPKNRLSLRRGGRRTQLEKLSPDDVHVLRGGPSASIQRVQHVLGVLQGPQVRAHRQVVRETPCRDRKGDIGDEGHPPEDFLHFVCKGVVSQRHQQGSGVQCPWWAMQQAYIDPEQQEHTSGAELELR